jgi:hypothetical protein
MSMDTKAISLCYSIDKYKIRQRAIEAGVLVVTTHFYCKTKDEDLKMKVHDEFVDRIQEQDLVFFFKHRDNLYHIVSDLVGKKEDREVINIMLKDLKQRLTK